MSANRQVPVVAGCTGGGNSMDMNPKTGSRPRTRGGPAIRSASTISPWLKDHRGAERAGPANWPRRRRAGKLATGVVVALSAVAVTGCGSDSPEAAAATPTLNWYINPDNGGQAELAAKCARQSGGRYDITVSMLPRDATSQREQLLRRLAAKDDTIDLMSLDPPFTAEFAEAGFLRLFTDQERQELTDGVLDGPVEGATYQGKLAAAPFWANTQLLWYRKSVADRAGADPAAEPVTWQQLIDAASRAGKTLEVQAGRYEGYMVWINALVESAGGSILDENSSGQPPGQVEAAIDSPAGQAAARVIKSLATSSAANPTLSTSDEETGRTAFQSDTGAYMVNWPYVWKAAQEGVEKGELPQDVLNDIGWARYPRVDGDTPSAPPLGGINLAIGAYSDHPELAVDAVRCLTSTESQKEYFLSSGNPAADSAVYADPQVRAQWPMADLIRESINDAAPRPITPYYGDVSAAVQRAFHPSADVQPRATPDRAAALIEGVLANKQLL